MRATQTLFHQQILSQMAMEHSSQDVVSCEPLAQSGSNRLYFRIMLADQRLAPETILKLIATASPEIQNVGEIRNLASRLKKKTEQQ